MESMAPQRFVWILAGALALALPANAQGPVPPPQPVAAPVVSAPLPGNSVSCVYESMTAEDREMALLLLAREIVDGGRFRKTSINVQAVDRLIQEAHGKCLDRFKWSRGRSDAATGYALTAILGEALGQAIVSFDKPIAAADEYYSSNRAALAGKMDLSKPEAVRLSSFLKSKGWDSASEAELGLAALYVETLMLQEQARREFISAGGASRQPSRRQPGRAGKAARGKP